MDLNQLYFEHQISLMRAKSAPSDQLRLIHCGNALSLAHHIKRVHRASGAGALRNWQTDNLCGDKRPDESRALRLACAQ